MLFVFNKFKKHKWIKYSPQKRLKIYNALEKKFAKKQNRQAILVKLHQDSTWSCFGMFTVKNDQKVIILNQDLVIDPTLRFHGMETILHEGRHAYQYEVVNKKLPWYAFRAKKWQKNWAGYISSSQSSSAYNHQIIEKDAQKYAFKQMMKLDSKFRGDPDWEHTLQINAMRIDSADKNARKDFGVFYKQKINKMIENKAKNSKF